MIKNLIWVFLILSVLFHLGSYWGSFVLKAPALSLSANKKVEVELVEKEANPQALAPPIRFSEAPKELLDDDLDRLRKKVDLLSEKAQRVKKETKANLFGLTKNRWNQPPTKDQMITPPKPVVETPTPTKPEDDNGFRAAMENPKNATNPLDPGLSTFGNQLDKKVEVGAFTALNTDRHLFYSFYSRIEEMIRPPWENKVIETARYVEATRPLRPKGGWSTRLDVLLNPKGQLLKVVLLKSSGIKGFDEAAIQAFQRAGFFPHPPREMVNEEGMIVLKYVFTVY